MWGGGLGDGEGFGGCSQAPTTHKDAAGNFCGLHFLLPEQPQEVNAIGPLWGRAGGDRSEKLSDFPQNPQEARGRHNLWLQEYFDKG